MDLLDGTERTVLRRLINDALIKLKILSLSPIKCDLMDPSSTYSIGDLLDAKIAALEDFDSLATQTIEDDFEQSEIEESLARPSDLENPYGFWRYSAQRMEIRELEEKMAALVQTLDDMYYEYSERTQLEIAKNNLVDKWESARRERLVHILNSRTENFRKQTFMQELEVESGLKAARKIEEFYNWQLATFQGEMNDWMNRIESEKEQIDSRLQLVRADKRKWDEMKAEVERRTHEIERLEQAESNYIRDAKHKQMCQKYAVKLQAWWRGVMVRKGLGPFRKGKKKGKSQKKVKGKGKKARK